MMPASVISLRPIHKGDEDFLRLVYAETRRQELDQVQWEEGARVAFLRMQFDAQSTHYFQHYPGAQFSLIQAGDQPIGRLYLARWTKETRVIDIALLPAARGQGIGGALLREIIREAFASGRSVTIHAEKHNPALTLYQRLGFRPIEDKGVYWLLECSPPPSGANGTST